MPMLCLRVFSDWRARFLADLMFATGFPCLGLQRAAYYSRPGLDCQQLQSWPGHRPTTAPYWAKLIAAMSTENSTANRPDDGSAKAGEIASGSGLAQKTSIALFR